MKVGVKRSASKVNCLIALAAAGCSAQGSLAVTNHDTEVTQRSFSTASTHTTVEGVEERQSGRAAAARAKPTQEATASAMCGAICAKTQELGCARAPECQMLCVQGMEDTLCQAHVRAVATCAIGKSASDWECNDEGLASIKDGVCVAEQTRVEACLLSL